MEKLSYQEFLKIAWSGWGTPRDAPIYQHIYINLVVAKAIEGDLSSLPKTPADFKPDIEGRLATIEKRVELLENKYSDENT